MRNLLDDAEISATVENIRKIAEDINERKQQFLEELPIPKLREVYHYVKENDEKGVVVSFQVVANKMDLDVNLTIGYLHYLCKRGLLRKDYDPVNRITRYRP